MEATDEVQAWASSGALALTGPPERPLGPPTGLVDALLALAGRIAERTGAMGRAVILDSLHLLVERAAIAGLRRKGQTSCGGATRLLPGLDGWLALSLARPDDVDLLPAWLGPASMSDGDPWAAVTAAVAGRPVHPLVHDGAELGLPVAALAERSAGPTSSNQHLGPAPATRGLDRLRVVDLTSLWAGPLCGSVLADAGADVIKVESVHRPDGARRGPRQFFDLMNAGKRSVTVDLQSPSGSAQLLALIRSADVVLESSRPRALEQLGIDAHDLVADAGPRVWVSLTGHGLGPAYRHRVGFGDDAAVAGGLVAWDHDRPCFLTDAVADPISGLVAADLALDALARGGRWRIDVGLAAVAARFRGPTISVPPSIVTAAPSVRRHRGAARPAGADTDEVLGTLGAGAT